MLSPETEKIWNEYAKKRQKEYLTPEKKRRYYLRQLAKQEIKKIKEGKHGKLLLEKCLKILS